MHTSIITTGATAFAESPVVTAPSLVVDSAPVSCDIFDSLEEPSAEDILSSEISDPASVFPVSVFPVSVVCRGSCRRG